MAGPTDAERRAQIQRESSAPGVDAAARAEARTPASTRTADVLKAVEASLGKSLSEAQKAIVAQAATAPEYADQQPPELAKALVTASGQPTADNQRAQAFKDSFVAPTSPTAGAVDQTQSILDAYLKNRPTDPLELTAWTKSLKDVIDTDSALRLRDAGVVVFPDGTYGGIQQALGSPDPTIREFAQKQQDATELKYAGMLDSLGLSQFNTYKAGVEAENTRQNQDYANRINRVNANLSYDQQAADTAARDVTRSVNGLAESRARATEATDAQLAAAPYGAPEGKTSFSANDVGGLGAAFARRGGIDPNVPLINFTGQTRIDPQALMQQGDARLGVSGNLPLIPGLTTRASDIPQVPTLTPIPQGGGGQNATLSLLQSILARQQGAPNSGAAVPLVPGLTGVR